MVDIVLIIESFGLAVLKELTSDLKILQLAQDLLY
jgi:hypothetical protein